MRFTGPAVLSLLLWSAGAGPATELIINGNFESIAIPGYAAQLAIPDALYGEQATLDSLAPGGSLYPNGVQTVTGWTTTGYNFLYLPGTAAVGGARNSWNETDMRFWGSAAQNGGVSAIPIPDTSPVGGNFLAMDAAYTYWADPDITFTQPVEQVVHGLVIGQEYELTFWWAAAQQYGFDGDTTEYVTVTFGAESYQTDTVSLASHDFQDWMQETVRFTATAASQTLSFLAGGGPDGLPPFVFLDGVSMQAVPEPGTMGLLTLGVSGFLVLRRRRRTSPRVG